MSSLEQILIDFAYDFQLLLESKIITADMIATRELADSMEVTSFYVNEKNFKVILRGVDYINMIEDGRKAGKMPPIQAILNWIEIKPILPRPEFDRDITNNQLAFLIARKIGNEGVPGKKLISQTLDEMIDTYRPLLKAAILKDIEKGIYKMMETEFFGYKNIKIKLK